MNPTWSGSLPPLQRKRWNMPGCEPRSNINSTKSAAPARGSLKQPTPPDAGWNVTCTTAPNNDSSRSAWPSGWPATDPELDSLLESASKEAKEALVELRELARGIHPAILTESGLSGAIEALVERSPVTTIVVALPSERLPTPVEATAYFIVSEALANVAK